MKNQVKELDKLYCMIFWQKARSKFNEILPDIKNKFVIHDVYEIFWTKDNFVNNLMRFYGDTLPDPTNKSELCGTGPFLLLIISDPSPSYGNRKTSRGTQKVNVNVYDKKMEYRRQIGGDFPIHGSIHEIEAEHDLMLLLGKNMKQLREELPNNWDDEIKIIKSDPIGTNGWKNLEEFFFVLNSTTNYVILRNFEELPEKLPITEHPDIDILIEDKKDIFFIANCMKRIEKYVYEKKDLLVNNVKIHLDCKMVGDGYYDEKWMKEILERRIFYKNSFFIPNNEDYFFSLLYHMIIQEKKIRSDYVGKLKKIAKTLDLNVNDETFINIDKLKEVLDSYIIKNEYRYTDTLSYRINHNEFFRLIKVANNALKKEGLSFLFRAIRKKISDKIR